MSLKYEPASEPLHISVKLRGLTAIGSMPEESDTGPATWKTAPVTSIATRVTSKVDSAFEKSSRGTTQVFTVLPFCPPAGGVCSSYTSLLGDV